MYYGTGTVDMHSVG